MKNYLVLKRDLTAVTSVPRLFFSRSGLVSRMTQLSFGVLTRFCLAIRLQGIAELLREYRSEQVESHRRSCQQLFEAAVVSSDFSLFLDFGAHTGEQVTQACQFMDVIAFEPDPRAFSRLTKCVDNLPLGHKTPKLRQCAVSTRNGVARLAYSDVSPEKTGGSTLASTKSEFSGENGTECETVDVLDIVKSLTSPESTILKMDIEGEEYQVLKRMMKHPHFRKLGLIFVEFHERKMRGGMFLGLLLTLRLWKSGLTRSRVIEWY